MNGGDGEGGGGIWVGKKRREEKKKQNKTRIMTNQDKKHGFQIKTDTMDV